MLTAMIAVPLLGALVVAFLPRERPVLIRRLALGFSIVPLVLTLVVWRIFTTIQTVLGDPVEQGPEALLASVMTLGLTALALILVWRLSPGRDVERPGNLPELWTAWSFPVAVALVGVVVLTVPVITAYYFWITFHLPGESVMVWLFGGVQALSSTWWRAIPGTALGIGAIILARRGRVGEASLLAAVCVVMVTGAIAIVLPAAMLRARTPDAIAAITSGLAIVAVSYTHLTLPTKRIV